MLKLVDNLDLKYLTEFGFKPKYDENTGKIVAYEKKNKTNEWLGIKIKPVVIETKIRIFKRTEKYWGINPYNDYFDADALYDLIQARISRKSLTVIYSS